MARLSTGKRLRFEIFKRDGFTCQYCGRTPPAVILHVDHIAPVSKGGGNDPLNLLTACADCNLGKANKTLSQVAKPIREQIEVEKERLAQVKQYNAFLVKAKQESDADIREIGLYWYNSYKTEQDAWIFGPSRVVGVRKFLTLLPKVKILEAIDIAFSRVKVHGDRDESAFRYFCGICWKTAKEADRA